MTFSISGISVQSIRFMPRKPVATVPIRPKVVTTVKRTHSVGLAPQAVGIQVLIHVVDALLDLGIQAHRASDD